MAKDPDKLTPREKRFVAAYLREPNATKAYIATGYTGKNADVLGPRMLGIAGVAAAIEKGEAKILNRAEISSARVLREIAKIGYASMRRFVHIDEDGQPQIDLSATPDDDLDALSEIATETVLERDGTDAEGKPVFNRIRKTKIKLHDKLAALEKLAQHTGVYKKRDEDMAGALARAITDIQERTSRAPIRRADQEPGEQP